MKKVIALLFLVALVKADTFEYVLNPDGTVREGIIKRLSDGSFIPTNPDNRDYKAFLTDATSIIRMPEISKPIDPVPDTTVQGQLDSIKTKVDALLTAVKAVATKTDTPVILPEASIEVTP